MYGQCIDAHHHLWKYVASEHPWMTKEMNVLQRDFLPEDLSALAAAGVTGTIVVEATRTLAETAWLINVAEHEDFIQGVVGWIPVTAPNVDTYLEPLAHHLKLKGLRHAIHDEPDDEFVLRSDFNRGIDRLAGYGLSFDLLIFEKHLPQTIKFVDLHPNQIFILDHIAKPRIRERSISPWKDYISELARRRNVYCKLSGLVTETNWQSWAEDELRPYIDVVLSAFGPQRLMYGSDWPVMLLAGDYVQWYDVVTTTISKLSKTEQDRIMGGTAIEVSRSRKWLIPGFPRVLRSLRQAWAPVHVNKHPR